MIVSISERNRSRRVVFPLFFHANPANVSCFPTRPSLVLLFQQYLAELRFPQHRSAGLVQTFLSGRSCGKVGNAKRFPRFHSSGDRSVPLVKRSDPELVKPNSPKVNFERFESYRMVAKRL